jgi:hypothetical protein
LLLYQVSFATYYMGLFCLALGLFCLYTRSLWSLPCVSFVTAVSSDNKQKNKQLPRMGTLELEHVSPALNDAREMSLSMPGHYGRSEVCACVCV